MSVLDTTPLATHDQVFPASQDLLLCPLNKTPLELAKTLLWGVWKDWSRFSPGTPKHSIQGLHPSVPGPATLCVCTPPGPPPHVASGGGLCTSPEISPLWSIIELGGHHWVTPPRLYVTSAGLTKSQQLANLQNLFQKVRYQTCHFLDFSTIVTFQYKQYKLTIKMIFYCLNSSCYEG